MYKLTENPSLNRQKADKPNEMATLPNGVTVDANKNEPMPGTSIPRENTERSSYGTQSIDCLASASKSADSTMGPKASAPKTVDSTMKPKSHASKTAGEVKRNIPNRKVKPG